MTTRSTQVAGGIGQKNTASGNFIADWYVVRKCFITKQGSFARFGGEAYFTELSIFAKDMGVCGVLKTDTINTKSADKTTIKSKLLTESSVFSKEDEFTRIFTFEGVGPVGIPPLISPYKPETVMITELPCMGTLSMPDIMTCVMEYTPVGDPPEMEMLQYNIQDECGVVHTVTQMICQQSLPLPPFINVGCALAPSPNGLFPPKQVDITPFVGEGSRTTDDSTLTFINVQVFGTSSNTTIPM